MKIKQHPGTGLWCREDGAILMPAHRNNRKMLRKFRWTYGSKKHSGYMEINYRGKRYRVHRLIAETFIPNPNGYPTVDHYPDRNRSNNAVSNLRWADRKMQNDNRQICEDSLAKYGVRCCDDPNAYQQAYYANNPEFAERQRAHKRALRANNPEYAERQRARCREYDHARRANDPEYAERRRAKNRAYYADNTEQKRAYNREYYAKQKALGKRQRTCPDGKIRRLTDEEFNERYKKD